MSSVKECLFFFSLEFINFGNRTEWSPVRSVILRVITKSSDCKTGVRFVNHEYDIQTELDDTRSCYQSIETVTKSEKKVIVKFKCFGEQNQQFRLFLIDRDA